MSLSFPPGRKRRGLEQTQMYWKQGRGRTCRKKSLQEGERSHLLIGQPRLPTSDSLLFGNVGLKLSNLTSFS
jgi:hypothetical protein